MHNLSIAHQVLESACCLLGHYPNKKLPLPVNVVRRIALDWGGVEASLDRIHTACLITLVFELFLRQDESHRLRRSSVSFFPSHMILSVHSRKNSQLREGQELFVERSSSDSCTVAMVERLIRTGGHHPCQPLFCRLYTRCSSLFLRGVLMFYSQTTEIVCSRTVSNIPFISTISHSFLHLFTPF